MSATLDINIKPWADQVRRLDKRMTNKTFPQLLRQQGKLLVQDLIVATPPFDKGTINGPLNAQRKVGEKAVETDIRRLFRPIPPIEQLIEKEKRLAFYIRKYIRLSEVGKLSTMLNRLKVRNSAVVVTATEGDHKKARNQKGKVPRSIKPIYVIKSRTISVLVTKMKKDVGKLKAGWCKAAKALKATVPNWISKHATPGDILDHSNNKDHPSITVRNDSAFGPQVEFKIVQFCLKKREGSMRQQIEALVNHATSTL